MGYRSEVAYKIEFENLKVMNEYIALVMAMGGDKLQALKECVVKRNPGAMYIAFHADDVKWYDTFPDVQAHHWLIDFAHERFPYTSASRFVRIGEDDNDNQIDEHGSTFYVDGLYIERRIDEIDFYGEEPIGDDIAVQEETPAEQA